MLMCKHTHYCSSLRITQPNYAGTSGFSSSNSHSTYRCVCVCARARSCVCARACVRVCVFVTIRFLKQVKTPVHNFRSKGGKMWGPLQPLLTIIQEGIPILNNCHYVSLSCKNTHANFQVKRLKKFDFR